MIRNEVTRYVKDKLELKSGSITVLKKTLYPHLGQLVRVYLSPHPFLVESERAFKVAKNVGYTRLRLRRTRASRANSGIQRISRLRPKNVEMNLFLKYNLRAINYEIYQLKIPPDEYLAPNSLNRDYTDDDSDDESMVTD